MSRELGSKMRTPGGRCVQCGLEETAGAWLSREQIEGWGRGGKRWPEARLQRG